MSTNSSSRWRSFFNNAAVAALSGLIAAGLPTVADAHKRTTQTSTADVALSAAAAAPVTLGVGTAYQWSMTRQFLAPDLGKASALGIKDMREDIFWQNVQPFAGVWNWTSYDQLFRSAAAQGVRILPILDYGVTWATGDADTHVVPHTDQARNSYAAYAVAVVNRYGPTGTFWKSNPTVPFLPATAVEVWNEPWYPGPTDPAVYTALVKTAAAAIHGAVPTMTVLANVDDRYRNFGNGKAGTWMNAVLDSQAGLDKWVNGWSIHPYPRDFRVSPAMQAADSVNQVKNLQNQLAARRLTGKIWVTEIGFHDRPSTFNALDSQATAATNFKTFVQCTSALGGANPVTAVFAFTTAREAVNPSQFTWDFGYNFFGSGGVPKPALAAFAGALPAQKVSGATMRK